MQLCKYAINTALDDYSSTANSTTAKMMEISVRLEEIIPTGSLTAVECVAQQQFRNNRNQAPRLALGASLTFSNSDTREVVDAKQSDGSHDSGYG
jgi:alpha-D-ribose 1-methylphosphonate 5-triphosphate synthase subunit PhnI